MTRSPAPRRAPRARGTLAWLAALALLASCVSIEDFFFAARPAEGYRFDERDPALDGDLSSPHPSIVPAALREEGFVASEGARLHWVFARQEAGPRRTTILFSHGNGPNLGRFWDRVEVLWRLGYQVLVYDYPGFGRSDGRPSEPGIHAAARAILAALASRGDVDPARIVLYGQSLGAAPSFDAAVRASRGEVLAERGEGPLEVRPLALVTEGAWCSIAEMVRDGAFLDLPSELATHLRFDSCARIAELRGIPTLLLHGERDRVVPPRQLALLIGRAAEPPRVERFADATHTDVPIVGAPDPALEPAGEAPRPGARYARVVTSFAPIEAP